jgi:hypothetical protein
LAAALGAAGAEAGAGADAGAVISRRENKGGFCQLLE